MPEVAHHELCVLYGEELREYGFPAPHPFGRQRLPAFWEEFLRRQLDLKCGIEAPDPCDEETLISFHSHGYVEQVKSASQSGSGFLDYGDTPAFKGVFEAARLVVGSTLKAARLVMEGKYRRAFCPIGGLHHARRDRAGGFCVFNDIGVAIEVLRRDYGLRRIAYVDIDAHHGDGVYYAYESDPDIFIADIHEDGRFLYPGTGSAEEIGKGAASGTKINFPLEPQAGNSEFMKAFEEVEKFIECGSPEIILLQCGADSVTDDPIAELDFDESCHAHAARSLRKLADKSAEGRLIAMGGGGYDLKNIAHAWCEVVHALE